MANEEFVIDVTKLTSYGVVGPMNLPEKSDNWALRVVALAISELFPSEILHRWNQEYYNDFQLKHMIFFPLLLGLEFFSHVVPR